MGIPDYQTLPSQAHPTPSRSRLGRLALAVLWTSLLFALCVLAVVGVGALVCAVILFMDGEHWLFGLGLIACLGLLAVAIGFVGKQVETVGRRRKAIDWGGHF